MKTIMVNAMEKTRGWKFCWWDDPMTSMVIDYGVKRGWLFRLSTTQVHWNEALFYKAPDGRWFFKPDAFERSYI
jgi:hypothetical protein